MSAAASAPAPPPGRCSASAVPGRAAPITQSATGCRRTRSASRTTPSGPSQRRLVSSLEPLATASALPSAIPSSQLRCPPPAHIYGGRDPAARPLSASTSHNRLGNQRKGATMNHVILSGRLTRDPELDPQQHERAICKMRVAVDNGKYATTYVDVATFDRQAYACAEHLSKGRKVGVSGKPHLRRVARRRGQPARALRRDRPGRVPRPPARPAPGRAGPASRRAGAERRAAAVRARGAKPKRCHSWRSPPEPAPGGPATAVGPPPSSRGAHRPRRPAAQLPSRRRRGSPSGPT